MKVRFIATARLIVGPSGENSGSSIAIYHNLSEAVVVVWREDVVGVAEVGCNLLVGIPEIIIRFHSLVTVTYSSKVVIRRSGYTFGSQQNTG